MTRDTFDRFQPQERGRFGDDEMPPSDSDEVEITCFQHASTAKALYLSRDGSVTGRVWIPRQFVKQVSATTTQRLRGVDVTVAQFSIAIWKVKELGWLQQEDERQGRLV